MVIGLARSGTSIVTSYLNSQPNAFVVGEPTWPQEHNRNQLVYSRYGEIVFNKKADIFVQLAQLASKLELALVGIKEAWTPSINAIRVADRYTDIVDSIIITVREPRRNYQSMFDHFASIGPVSSAMFERRYKMLFEYGMNNPRAKFIVLEQFKKDPVGILRKAVNFEIEEVEELQRYSGGGCKNVRTSTTVEDKEIREQSEGSYPTAEIAYRLILREVEKYE
jgi:hypothetical protein